MATNIDFSRMVQGEPTKCIVRIKPPTNFQKEDIRTNGPNIIITDSNNRVVEEFEVPEVYGPEFNMQQIYDQSLSQYIGPFIQGLNVNIIAFGSSGTGKTQTVEGNKKEHGLIVFFASTLFQMLENKKFHTNQAQSSQITNYGYGIRIRYVEIIDEEITDLLAPPNKRLSDQLQVIDNSWEGPIIANSTWVNVSNETQLSEVLNNGQKNRNMTSNEFGKVANKATSFFTIELIQTSQIKENNEPLILLSRLCFWDLPGSEVLTEDPEALRIKQGSTLNKVIIAFTQLIKELGQRQSEYVPYETSTATHLLKEVLGSNALNILLFLCQHGDAKGSSLTLNMFKYAQKVQSYPIVNDGKTLGLLHKMRMEIASRQGGRIGGGGGDGQSNHKLIELEKKLIEDNLDKMRQADDKQKLAQKLSALREKYNDMVKEKAELQQELIKSEEDKLEVSKALVELQIENTRLMEIIQNEKYEMNHKLLNAESDLLSINLREEKAIKTIQELQDRLKELSDEKRELEIEFVSLKKNYLNCNLHLEAEKAKSENIGLELINVVNENKALHQELNDIYKKSGSTNEENARFMKKLERLETENKEQREALMYSKAEIERLKTEMLKYEIFEQQHKIDLDNKKLEMEKGFLEHNRDKQTEVFKMNREADEVIKKTKDEKLIWDSQRMELTQKIKSLQRKITDDDERMKDLERQLQETLSENQKMHLQMDEMRSIYRNKLIQFTTEASKPADKPIRMGYDLNAREELIRTYTEKEIDLNERIEREKKLSRQMKQELQAIRSYARNLRYLAEDWAPVGVPLPDILNKDPAFLYATEENYGSLQQDHQAEIERLRSRNKKLENEVRILQESIMTGAGQGDINKRLMTELQQLKGQPEQIRKTNQSDFQGEQFRKERTELQEENRRLVQMLKDNRKWDLYILQRENERLQQQLKEKNNFGDGSIGPISGETKGQQAKIAFYEKQFRIVEKERSEYMVRATMAEEQLKSLQEHLNKVTQDYQKKIMDMKRQMPSKIDGF